MISKLPSLCYNGDLDSVRGLVGQGEDVNCNNKNFGNSTGLMEAVKEKHNSIVKFLLEQPTLDLNWANSEGWTALHFAADAVAVDGVQLLLADPRLNTQNHMDDGGNTPVMMAIWSKKVNSLRALVVHPSVDLDTGDDLGRSLEDFARWVIY